MEPESLTVEILKGIRDEIKTTNVRLESVEQQVKGVKEEVNGVKQAQVQMELRLATELIAVAQAVHEVRDMLKDNADLRRKVDDHELRLKQIEERLTS